MTFTRTASALLSMHRFFGVDLVVFCEGGPSLGYSEALKLQLAGSTLDTLYWSAIFHFLNNGRSAHFKSVGGKETINKICDDVHRLGVNTISVCRDSDYDRVMCKVPPGNRIAWSFGYSWENDVVSLEVVESLAESFLGVGPERTDVVDKIRLKISCFDRELQRWVEIDASLCHRGHGGVFDREKPLASIDMAAPPSLRLQPLMQRLAAAGYSRKPRRVFEVLPGQSLTVCFGKLVSKAIYHVFRQEIGRYAQISISYELFMRLAITETFRSLRAGGVPNLAQHALSQGAAFI